MSDETPDHSSLSKGEPSPVGRRTKKGVKTPPVKPVSKKTSPTAAKNSPKASNKPTPKRKRRLLPFPTVPFNQAAVIGKGMHEIGSGERVRLLTLLKHLALSPTSSSTQLLITNSGKYGITVGSYLAEWLDFTPLGKTASDPDANPGDGLRARFDLGIKGVEPFNLLYEKYKGKRLVAASVMADTLESEELEIGDINECVDIFITNMQDLGLLQTIAGSQTQLSIEHAIEECQRLAAKTPTTPAQHSTISSDVGHADSSTNWNNICFYVSPIGDTESDIRKHSDLYKNHIVEPAMEGLGLTVVRADEIGTAGMITSTIIEYLRHSKLVIADLTSLNPNVFYEIAVRHACKLPIIQIRRKGEILPFDVGQINTVEIDSTDVHTFVPKLNTYIAEVASLSRAALQNADRTSNVITVFYPKFWEGL